MNIARIIDLPGLLEKKSFFLFGPRATGKTTTIKQQLSGQVTLVDLLDSRLFLKLSSEPYELESLVDSSSNDLVVIDEIQRIPELLNEVHRLIENKSITFLLTGSSARKLRRGKANLLAGRVWQAGMFPFSWRELEDFDLDRFLFTGGLPAVWCSQNPLEELDAYVNTYLREEIMAEGLIRKLPPFSRFLKSMALSNAEIINISKVANDCQVPPSTVSEYISLLEDTLVGFMLSPWTDSRKRKAIRTAKFYFFDTGVTHVLAGTESLDRNSNLYGKSFEQFIGMEIRAYLSYGRKRQALTYWRSYSGHEVDYLIGTKIAVEVKATKRLTKRDFKGLDALAEEGVFEKYFLVSQDPVETKKDHIRAVYWENFLQELWDGNIL